MELLDYMEDLLMLTYQKMQSSQFFYQDKNISQNCWSKIYIIRSITVEYRKCLHN